MKGRRAFEKLPTNVVAVAYLRVSSQGQSLEHRHGFERQEAACRAWAKEHRRTLSAVYRDAHTGTELQIQSVFNQLEKERLVIKMHKARETKRQKVGRCEGRKCYGEHQAHAERESAAVDLVKQLRRKPIGGERLSLVAIATELNARAEQSPTLRPRTAAKWHPTLIGRILTRA